MTTILVAGAIANKLHNGGEAWVRLSWLRGFQDLGLQTYFVEQIRTADCRDEVGGPASFRDSGNRAYFREVIEEFGITERSALISDSGETEGLSLEEVVEAAGRSVLLVNISGHLSLPEILGRCRRTAYVDIDPGYTQFWHASGSLRAQIDRHDVHFTIGRNIGSSGCPIPTGDISWRTMYPPVVIGDWPVTGEGSRHRFTAVGSWRGAYGSVEFQGRRYGVRAHEFRKVIELPRLVRLAFEIALHIDPEDASDLEALLAHGWQIVDPAAVAGGPMSFRSYIQGSGSEFGVAQGLYVETNSGWFSDRTARYLASGRPTLVQDTGFSRHLPVGEGLVVFRTLDEAVEGALRIHADYERHSHAARRMAVTYFDSRSVLTQFLEQAGV